MAIKISYWATATVFLFGLVALGLFGCDADRGLKEPQAVGGPAVLRRLTESQYRAGIADIFDPAISIAARFEQATRTDGLIAIGTGAAGVSPFSVEQYDAAARSVASAVVSEEWREQLLPCQPADPSKPDQACAQKVVEQFGTQLLRRPLAAMEIENFVETSTAGTETLGDFYSGLQYALAGLLVSPEFLLRIENTVTDEAGVDEGRLQLDSYSKATRLSYFLTDSTPDLELLRAAKAGELESGEGLIKQVDRLIASPRFEGAVRAFFSDILEFDHFNDLAKDPVIYPAFTLEAAADAKEQTLRTIIHHLIENEGDYRELFTTRDTFLTRSLGIIYRLPVSTRNGWEQQTFPEFANRSGIHTHVSFLALHSHPGRSSSTLRGTAVRETFLCQEVPEPPANVVFDVDQDMTNAEKPTARDRLEAHRTEPACAGCHKMMDPVGLTLENFDGVGTWRTTENGAVIDASGNLDGMPYTDAVGLGQALRDHPSTASCLVEKMYRFAVGRDTMWEEREYMDYLIESFRTSGYRLPALMRTIALSNNFFTIATEYAEKVEYSVAENNEPVSDLSSTSGGVL